MHCTRCHSSMSQEKQEINGNCQQTWYRCPACGQEQCVTRRVLVPSPVQYGMAGGQGVTRAWARRG